MTKKQRGIYERVLGSNVWWIRYADKSGRIRREKGGTKSAAIKLYRKRKTEVLEGKKLPESFRARPILFSELAQDALEYSETHKRSHKSDCVRMAPLVKEFGSSPASSMTPQVLERWIAEQSCNNEWKPATANRFKALLSLTFRLGVENGKVKDNPAKLVRRRPENNGRLRFLSRQEEVRLRVVLERDYSAHIQEFDIALHTGMRRSEQYRLDWGNVNLESRTITIPFGKNNESRYVRLNKVALSAFQQLFARSQGSGPVFVNARFEPLLGPRHWFDPATHAAGLADFTWHCLRHTFASRLVMQNVNLTSVQKALGHKSVQMTSRYAHLAPEYELAAVEKLCEDNNSKETLLERPTDTRTSTATDRSNGTEKPQVH